MEKINILDPTTTNKVISIVNDLVFTENYQTIEQSHSHIREKLKECFDDFLDGDQKDLLDEKIKNMKITRCFQILGSRNSISKFLLEKQTKIFNENRKTPITLDIEYLLTLSKQPYSYLLNKIQESTDIKNFFAEICNQIDFDINLFYDSDNFDIFREKIQTIYAEIKKQPYSKNPQENEQMEYLEQYVDSYKDYLKSQGQNQDYYNNIEKIKEFDPLFNQLTKHLPEEEKEVCCEGFFNKNTDQIGAFSCRGNIYLGIDPEGGIIFHEAFHALLGKIAQMVSLLFCKIDSSIVS